MPTNGARGRKQDDTRARAGRLTEKSKSFHGKLPAPAKVGLRRPKTQPDLFSARSASGVSALTPVTPGSLVPQLTRVLVNVTVKGGLGPLHVVMSLESTVEELVVAAVRQYEKEGRRPLLPTADPEEFDLHYSQFSLESLDRKAELIALGSRNFFLCPKPAAAAGEASCSRQAEKASTSGIKWLRLVDFLL